MKSKLIGAAVLAISALTAVGSYADGVGGRAPGATTSVVTTRPAVIKAELAAAKNSGQTMTSDNNYPVVVAAKNSTGKTRNQVRAERTGDSAYLQYDNYLYSR